MKRTEFLKGLAAIVGAGLSLSSFGSFDSLEAIANTPDKQKREVRENKLSKLSVEKYKSNYKGEISEARNPNELKNIIKEKYKRNESKEDIIKKTIVQFTGREASPDGVPAEYEVLDYFDREDYVDVLARVSLNPGKEKGDLYVFRIGKKDSRAIKLSDTPSVGEIACFDSKGRVLYSELSFPRSSLTIGEYRIAVLEPDKDKNAYKDVGILEMPKDMKNRDFSRIYQARVDGKDVVALLEEGYGGNGGNEPRNYVSYFTYRTEGDEKK